MRVTHLFAGLAVSDFTVACEWYERLFDAPGRLIATDPDGNRIKLFEDPAGA